MSISMIVAYSEYTRVIGLADGGLPWHLPEDLNYFRQMTIGRIVIMGRKTYESLSKKLYNRTIYVLTRDPNYDPKDSDVQVYTDIHKCLMMAQLKSEIDIMVAGGGEIYRLLLPYTDTIYATEVYGEYEGETTFPKLPKDEWTPVYENQVVNENLQLFYCRYTYKRIR